MRRIGNNPLGMAKLEKVVLLIRSPLEAGLAERTRRKVKGAGGHRAQIKNYTLLLLDE